MTQTRDSFFLRRALLADAAISGVSGVLMILAADPLAGLFDLPESLLRWAGLALLPFAALLAVLATCEQPARPVVRAVVVANAVWAVASILVLFTGWVAPNAVGTAFVVAQAAVVAVFAELQWLGLKRSAPVVS